VASAVIYAPVANLTALAALSPADGDYFELADSTGAESSSLVSGVPSGLVGAAGLSFRLRYDDPPDEFAFLGYFANDSETRYLKQAGGTLTGAISVPLGSASAPSIYPGSDTDTGLFSPGADQLALSTAGTSRLHIASDGKVGVGTSSPLTTLHTNINSAVEWTSGANLSNPTNIPNVAFYLANDDTSITGTEVSLLFAAGGSASALHSLAVKRSGANTGDLIFRRRTGSTSSAESLRIDSSGRLLVGTSSARTQANVFAPLQVETAGSNPYGGIGVITNANNTVGASLLLSKTRGTANGSTTIVQSGDDVGSIWFTGADGTDLTTPAARIFCQVDGTPDVDDMPGRLVFSTTADGAAASTERMRIDSTGRTRIFGNTIVSNVNVAGASYDGVSFSVSAQDLTPSALFFSPDGRKMFVTGGSGDDVNEYTLSTPWVVSSATFVTVFSVAAQDTSPQGLFFRADGLKMYIAGNTGDAVYQYALTTPWSVATASYESKSFSVATEETVLLGLAFKPDGLSMYVVGSNSDSVHQYTLSTAWDVTTASILQSFSVAGQETAPNDLSLTADGTRMFVLGDTGNDVTIYNLTTPWDISTAAHVTQFSVSAQEGTPSGLFVKPDGTKFYIVGTANDTVYQYTIPSAQIDLTGTTKLNGDVEVAQDLVVRGDLTGPRLLTAAGTSSASQPAISKADDPNTGIFFPAADTIAASTDGSERARLTSTGALLVGTSTASGYLLEVNGSLRSGSEVRNGHLFTNGTASSGLGTLVKQYNLTKGRISDTENNVDCFEFNLSATGANSSDYSAFAGRLTIVQAGATTGGVNRRTAYFVNILVHRASTGNVTLTLGTPEVLGTAISPTIALTTATNTSGILGIDLNAGNTSTGFFTVTLEGNQVGRAAANDTIIVSIV
jgi:sugar lactone lactonase YvrE